MSTVYTGGTFDLFHAGHVNFLRQCRRLAGPGGSVIVALNTDEFVASYKGHAPVVPYEARKAVLHACEYVDEVIENVGGADSKPAILSVGPDIVAIDTGWALLDYYKQMGFTQAWLDERGILLVYLPRTPGISSSAIRDRMTNPTP